MKLFHSVFATFLLAPSAVCAADGTLRSGLYEVEHSLEMPHLERYAIVRSAEVCIDMRKSSAGSPIPLFGAAAAFKGCTVENLHSGADLLTYDIACGGRDANRAHAAYNLSQDGFSGRVAMIMGAKNMTMVEVQVGRRLGNCSLAER